jgi:flagellar basal-body rod protein FlgC
MSLSRAMDISATGLTAERTRIETIAQNIANVETVVDGGQPYRRREVVLASQSGFGHGIAARLGKAGVAGGVRVAAIREDTTPPLLVYRPEDPAADAQGYVHLSNVNLPMEMVDMVSATRAYEANAAAFKAGKETLRRTLDILR